MQRTANDALAASRSGPPKDVHSAAALKPIKPLTLYTPENKAHNQLLIFHEYPQARVRKMIL